MANNDEQRVRRAVARMRKDEARRELERARKAVEGRFVWADDGAMEVR